MNSAPRLGTLRGPCTPRGRLGSMPPYYAKTAKRLVAARCWCWLLGCWCWLLGCSAARVLVQVRYHDGDREELTEAELRPVLPHNPRQY